MKRSKVFVTLLPDATEMRSVPPRGSGFLIADCQLPIYD